MIFSKEKEDIWLYKLLDFNVFFFIKFRVFDCDLILVDDKESEVFVILIWMDLFFLNFYWICGLLLFLILCVLIIILVGDVFFFECFEVFGDLFEKFVIFFFVFFKYRFENEGVLFFFWGIKVSNW